MRGMGDLSLRAESGGQDWFSSDLRSPKRSAADAFLSVRSEPKYVPLARALFRTVCAGVGLPRNDVEDMTIAVGEAVSNAIQHGSRKGGKDYFTVELVPWQNSGGKGRTLAAGLLDATVEG